MSLTRVDVKRPRSRGSPRRKVKECPLVASADSWPVSRLTNPVWGSDPWPLAASVQTLVATGRPLPSPVGASQSRALLLDLWLLRGRVPRICSGMRTNSLGEEKPRMKHGISFTSVA